MRKHMNDLGKKLIIRFQLHIGKQNDPKGYQKQCCPYHANDITIIRHQLSDTFYDNIGKRSLIGCMFCKKSPPAAGILQPVKLHPPQGRLEQLCFLLWAHLAVGKHIPICIENPPGSIDLIIVLIKIRRADPEIHRSH